VTVSAGASDNMGVAGVQFRLDGNLLGYEDITAPYSISWNSTLASNGVHLLTAVARDAAWNVTISSSISVTVDNTQPRVEMTAPAVSGTEVKIPTLYSDNVGVTRLVFSYRTSNCAMPPCLESIEEIVFPTPETNGRHEWLWDTTRNPSDLYFLNVRAYDAAGNFSRADQAVIMDSTPPRVFITAPGNNSTVSGRVSMEANAQDELAVRTPGILCG
jgi:hypothetical protein